MRLIIKKLKFIIETHANDKLIMDNQVREIESLKSIIETHTNDKSIIDNQVREIESLKLTIETYYDKLMKKRNNDFI